MDVSKKMSGAGLKEYTDLHYKLFRFGDFKVSVNNGEFKCPFCAKDESNSHYTYTDLLQHSIRMTEESTSQKGRVKHSAMARYLAIDLADHKPPSSTRKRSRSDTSSAAAKRNQLNKVDELETKIIEMSVEMNALIASKYELQSVRKQLIKCLGEMKNGKNGDMIGIKKMGELDPKVFIEELGSEVEGVELCTFWQERINNPHWYPFQIVIDNEGKPKRVVKEDDCTLQSLKGEWGDAIHDKVVEAMTDLLEHNPSGCYPVPELWNFGEGRKAELDEVIRHLFLRLQPQTKELADTPSSSTRRSKRLKNKSKNS